MGRMDLAQELVVEERRPELANANMDQAVQEAHPTLHRVTITIVVSYRIYLLTNEPGLVTNFTVVTS